MLAIGSRADELVSIANDDSLTRYQDLVRQATFSSNRSSADTLAVNTAVSECLVTVEKLADTRATRLSQETKSLPAAHFFILLIFSLQLLFSFVFAVAGTPGTENDLLLRTLFSFFSGTYLLVFNFAVDLNSPFDGNYQIRRSAINANLISARRTIASCVGEFTATLWQLDEIRDDARGLE